MNIDPIHIGQVALANTLALAARDIRCQGKKHQIARPALRQRLAHWLNALIPTHS